MLIDVQLGEEGLVELSPDVVGRTDVQPVTALQQLQRLLESLLGQGVVGAGQLQQPLGVTLLDGQCLLALLEVGNRQGFGQVGVDQLLPLDDQLLEPPPLTDEQLLVSLPLRGELGLDGFAGRGDEFRIEPHGPPVAQDVVFHDIKRYERQLAGSALLIAAEAVEVRVDVAALPPRVADGQPLVTLGAEQAAFQVVIVSPGAVTCQPAPGQHVLHPVPGFVVDQGLMLAGILNAAVDHLADVVRARQDAVHLAARQRHGCTGGGRASAHAPPLQFVDQIANRPLAARVGIKGPDDVRRPLGVELDGFDLAAVDPGAGIEVAQRRVPGRAATSGLLVQPLLGLVRQVLGVKLSNRRHDAVQERAGRCVIDLLRGRDQHRPGLVNRQSNRHVIGAVAGQPIDLVHDDVLDVTALHQTIQ